VIQWENHDSLDHSVTSGQPKDDNAGELFDSGLLTKGEAVCVQFNKPGYFHYFCTGHSDGNGGGVDVTKE
jgi:plastocyanin